MLLMFRSICICSRKSVYFLRVEIARSASDSCCQQALLLFDAFCTVRTMSTEFSELDDATTQSVLVAISTIQAVSTAVLNKIINDPS